MKLSELLGISEREFINNIEKKEFMMAEIERLGLVEKMKEGNNGDCYISLLSGKKLLNLGCGNRKLKGFINIDKAKIVRPDICWDLEQGLPKMPKDSIDGVYASQLMEHIKFYPNLMEDIYRVCKNGALVVIGVPHYKSEYAFSDPTHVRFFTEHTFEYFSQEHRKRNSHLFDYDYKCDFEILSTDIIEGIMTVVLKTIKEDNNGRRKNQKGK